MSNLLSDNQVSDNILSRYYSKRKKKGTIFLARGRSLGKLDLRMVGPHWSNGPRA